MSWGFEAINNAGQVLVSSETRNLHFVGKAGLNRVITAFNGYGGLRHWAFWIDCEVTPVPFFTMPTDDYYGIASVREINLYPNSKTWEIQVIRSGTSDTVPEVYVFADPRGKVGRNSDYGMLVLRDDGTPSFDSRLGPLVVTGGINVTPPSNPRVSGPGGLDPTECHSDGSSSLAPDTRNQYTLNVGVGKNIFFFPSIAQAQREFRVERTQRDCIGFDVYGGCLGYGVEQRWRSTYWAFYRGGIRYVGGYLYCGWITATYGCNWDYRRDNSLVYVGIGGSSGQGGAWPYSNETLNLVPTAVITANGARYD